jgi:hypothetical protein
MAALSLSEFERYVVVNPLATFRVREARQLSREKTDLTDAEQIAELCRTGLVTRTQLARTAPVTGSGADGPDVREEPGPGTGIVRRYGISSSSASTTSISATPAAMWAVSISIRATARCTSRARTIHRAAAQTIACPGRTYATASHRCPVASKAKTRAPPARPRAAGVGLLEAVRRGHLVAVVGRVGVREVVGCASRTRAGAA